MTLQGKRTRPRGFAPWTPSAALVERVQAVLDVLAEYQAHLPLTNRQVFYRLVATRAYDKTEPDPPHPARRRGYDAFRAAVGRSPDGAAECCSRLHG